LLDGKLRSHTEIVKIPGAILSAGTAATAATAPSRTGKKGSPHLERPEIKSEEAWTQAEECSGWRRTCACATESAAEVAAPPTAAAPAKQTAAKLKAALRHQ